MFDIRPRHTRGAIRIMGAMGAMGVMGVMGKNW